MGPLKGATSIYHNTVNNGPSIGEYTKPIVDDKSRARALPPYRPGAASVITNRSIYGRIEATAECPNLSAASVLTYKECRMVSHGAFITPTVESNYLTPDTPDTLSSCMGTTVGLSRLAESTK